MLTLALESSTITVGVALIEEGEVLAERVVASPRHQTETLHPLILEVLDSVGRSIDECSAVAVDLGPGLFTGLRVGVASAKALAVALGVPLLGCTSTEALCFDATPAALEGGRAIAVVDVRRSEVAFATSESPGSPVICSPEECVRRLADRTGLKGAVLCGDGAERYRADFEELAELLALVRDERLAYPSPGAVGRLGERAFASGNVLDPMRAEPLYLRAPDAKINWTMRDLRKTRPQ